MTHDLTDAPPPVRVRLSLAVAAVVACIVRAPITVTLKVKGVTRDVRVRPSRRYWIRVAWRCLRGHYPPRGL